MTRRFKPSVALAAVLIAALAAAAFSAANVTFSEAERSGQPAGEVYIGDSLVMVLLTSAGGYAPDDRAEIIAGRLAEMLAQDPAPDTIRVFPAGGATDLYIGDRWLTTASQNEANAHGTTPAALAILWRHNIVAAISPEQAATAAAAEAAPETAAPEGTAAPQTDVAPEEAAALQPASPEEIDWTGTAQKWVPVFSLETEGARIGFAQVAGTPAQVGRVKGVVQLRLEYRNIGRIYAYIPVATLSFTKLDRVQGVSVWALADVRVLNF